jgi:D-glycero-alpha-D-manno-heptose-7-phosphate kinase
LVEDFDARQLIEQEMQHRRQLAPGIVTPEIEEMITFAKESGAKAAKICGAGGGGCVLFWVNPGDKLPLQRALKEKQVQIIDFHIDSEGLSVAAH